MTRRSLGLRPAVLLTTLLAVLLPMALTGAAHAASGFTVRDPLGDVRILDRGAGWTGAELRSIDLRTVRVTRKSGGTVFRVRIADVRPRMDGDQMVFLTATPPKGAGRFPRLDVGMSAQQRDLGYAILTTGNTSYRTCDPLRARVDDRASAISLRIPKRCLPRTKVRLHVASYVGYFRSEGPSASKDKIPYTRPVRLR
ncbi:MAG: hypothetical protein CMH83_13640 [Nocardioides sp.]|nr:hypothetical protein [Nocardioides sp.]